MSVILKEIEKRQQILDEHDGKVARVDALKAELACLEKEVSETNTFELKAEIAELKDYAIQLGLIEAPVVEEKNAMETEELVEEVAQEVETTYQMPVTAI